MARLTRLEIMSSCGSARFRKIHQQGLKQGLTMTSKFAISLFFTTVLVFSAGTASAKGCIKGAVAGAVAGHMAGGHAVLGAAGGCIVGRKLANKKAAEQKAQAANPALAQ